MTADIDRQLRDPVTIHISHKGNRHGGQWFARLGEQKKFHRFPGPVLAKLLGRAPDKDNFYTLTFCPSGLFDNPTYDLKENTEVLCD
jgi:hypothetical protein